MIASHYLMHSKKSIRQISSELGFKKKDSFCRAYARTTGVSASAFRKKYKTSLRAQETFEKR
jgi:transcriptional regulator GlxA family with amidase domain